MSNDHITNKQMDAADAMAEADTRAVGVESARKHGEALQGGSAGNLVPVAHVTVGDKTVTVAADKVSDALVAIHGKPVAGMRLNAHIVFDAMSQSEFATLSKNQ